MILSLRVQRWMERNRPWEGMCGSGDLLVESESWNLTLEQRQSIPVLYRFLLDKAEIYFEVCGMIGGDV